MSFAYMPLFTGDYLRDTKHLTPEEHGIYLLLLMHSWDQKAPVTLDERRQCGIVNARSGGEIESLRRVLCEFFAKMDDGWYNKRLWEEIERANTISSKHREAARARWDARGKLMALEAPDANALQSQSNRNARGPSPALPPSLTKILNSEVQEREAATSVARPAPAAKPEAKKRGTRLAEDWDLPTAWQEWAVKAYHLDPQRVYRISLDFRDYWHSKAGKGAVMLDWEATWRRWIRREMQDA